MSGMFSWLGYGESQEAKQEAKKDENKAENSEDLSKDGDEVSKDKDETAKTEQQEPESKADTDQKTTSNLQQDFDYAKDMAKNVGSFLFNMASVASSTALRVKDTVEQKTILGDFIKEQEKFVKEKHKRTETAVPPWVGYNEEASMKSQILALSTDERNFLRDPPSGVQFHYDNDSMFPVALATLEEDENLQQMRFDLVPKKVKEEKFWRNYFYRVSLIKQSTQLTSLASSGTEKPVTQAETTEGQAETDSSPSAPKSIPTNVDKDHINDIPDSPTQHEFISDDFVHQEAQHELSHEDLQQIGVDRKALAADADTTTKKTPDPKPPPEEDIPEWEKELQQELQDYEVVDEEDNGEWEKEIEDLLEAES